MPVLLSIHHAILHLPFKEKRHLVRNPLLHQSVGKAAGTRTGEGAARHPQENRPFPVGKISRKAILQKIPRFHVSRRHETFIPFPPASAPCSMSPLQNAPCGTGCILRPDKSPALAEDAKKRPASIGKHHCAGPRFLPVFRSGNLPGGQPCRPVPQSFQHPVAVPLQPPAAEPYLSGHGGKADHKTGQIPAVGSQPQGIREKNGYYILNLETT